VGETCTGYAEWTVLLPETGWSQFHEVDQLILQKRGDGYFTEDYIDKLKIKYVDLDRNWVDYKNGDYVYTGQNSS
jgi:hypothetical protein